MKSFGSRPWVLPQPVLIIGTYGKDGQPNAMNAAWGGQIDMHEVIISMGSHATTENLAANGGEFTLAFATRQTLVASDYVGIVSARNVPNKIDKTGWKVEKAPSVNAPLFTDFPLTMECRITRKIDEDAGGYYLIAEIVNILADEKFLSADGKPDLSKMDLICFDPIHMGYLSVQDRVGNAFADGKKLG